MLNKSFIFIALLSVSILHAGAQAGGALNRARNAAEQATKQATDAAQKATGQPAAQPAEGQSVIPGASSSSGLSSAQQAAVAKLLDPSKRSAPRVAELGEGAERPGGELRKFFQEMPQKSVADVQAFKAKLEAHHAENLEIFALLFDFQGNAADFVENSHERDITQTRTKDGVRNAMGISSADEELKNELVRYKDIIGRARQSVSESAKITISGDMASGNASYRVESFTIGIHFLGVQDDEFLFFVTDRTRPNNRRVTPVENPQFVAEATRYDQLQNLLKRGETNENQYEEYWKALIALQVMVPAQKRSLAMQEKSPVPSAQMNDAALTAKMLRLVQARYPDMGIVQVVIIEPAWRPVHNALGQIIHRIINTSMIYPRGNGYVMTTFSFIEPYAGGGNYGETQPHGIGTDSVAVDYK